MPLKAERVCKHCTMSVRSHVLHGLCAGWKCLYAPGCFDPVRCRTCDIELRFTLDKPSIPSSYLNHNFCPDCIINGYQASR